MGFTCLVIMLIFVSSFFTTKNKKRKTSKKQQAMKKITIFAVSALMLVSFSYNGDSSKKGLLKGEEVKIYGGKGWSWAKISKKGNPESVGFTITDEALASVPIGNGTGDHNAHGAAHEHWIAKFNPVAGTIIPFNFVMLNWNPNGHPPENIYDKPHFDFHFYQQTPEEVMAIGPYEVDSLKFNNVPAPQYFPEKYVNTNHSLPQMGAHWVDVTSSELHGKPFTETFIYGSYNGKVTFYEPMITLEFLKTQKTYERAIPVPGKFQESGWYPTAMRIVKHDGQTDVILDKIANT
jgi:hypothetical protein